MSSSLLLKNIYTLQTSFDKEALHGADLLIIDNKVGRIDPAGKISSKGVDRVIDCSKHVVLPGLVNTHHHFYQTLTRNHPAVQNAKLFDWLTFLYDVWKYLDEEGIYYSSLLAMAELMRTGCTLTTDHHYVYPHHVQGDPMAIQFEAAETLGMRFSPTRGSMSLSKKDGGCRLIPWCRPKSRSFATVKTRSGASTTAAPMRCGKSPSLPAAPSRLQKN